MDDNSDILISPNMLNMGLLTLNKMMASGEEAAKIVSYVYASMEFQRQADAEKNKPEAELIVRPSSIILPS